MTREWLLSHNIEDASEIISFNTELENQLHQIKIEKDELAMLNDNLYQKLDVQATENHKLKEDLHGNFFIFFFCLFYKLFFY